MLFNSIEFAVFLPLVFAIYWLLRSAPLRLQNGFLVAASYVFYGWWDWRFLGLILASTVTDFAIGLRLSRAEQAGPRKRLLWVSVLVNLGLLGFFKYHDFFVENFQQAFTLFGAELPGYSLSIVLPVGISFYTFQTLSYTIDVYRERLPATRDFVAFSAFVSFFPQLVAGPIERATNLLPQFHRSRSFDYGQAVDGMRQILWGLFKKVVVADNAAAVANQIFNNSADYSGSTLVLGAVFFSFQIYGDFSGYSDVAIGTARLFGFELRQNFAFPYFSRDIAEFWRRWHISLSSWFRDYVYIPLGGSRGGTWMKVRNTFIIFGASGFWHGANWTFVVWGLLNALYFMPLMLLKSNRRNTDTVAQGRLLPSVRELLGMLSTFGLTVIAWIFFRADSVGHALDYLGEVFSASTLSLPAPPRVRLVLETCVLIAMMSTVEWFGRDRAHALERFGASWPVPARWAVYYAIMLLILFFHGEQQDFIYFQF